MPADYTVEITQEGRSGSVIYREPGSGEYRTWWEFAAGARVLVFIDVPTPEQWDAHVPWAAGRRREVLERIGQEAVRQQAPENAFEIDDRQINLLCGRR